jgi:hypothetical protein
MTAGFWGGQLNWTAAGASNARHTVDISYEGYRYRIHNFFARLGINAQARGLNSDGAWTEPKHCGVSGQDIEGLDTFVDDRFDGGTSPFTGADALDLVIIDIGSANCIDAASHPYAPITTKAAYISMLENVLTRTASTGARVLVHNVSPLSGNPASIPLLNADIVAAVSEVAAANPTRRLAHLDCFALLGSTYRADDTVDGLHHSRISTHDVIGGATLQALVDLLDLDLGSLSVYLRTARVNHFRNKGTRTPAATHDYACFVAGVEVSGNNYSRKSITNNKTTYSDAANLSLTNDIAIVWATPSGTWGSVDEIRVYEGGTSNELFRQVLVTPVTIDNTTGPPQIAVGELDVLWVEGCLPASEIHAMLDHEFGGSTYAPRATVYACYCDANPQNSGDQLSAARTAVTQAGTWGAGSAGVATTVAAIALDDEVGATFYAEYDAPTAGNLVFSTALTSAPSGDEIPVGGIQTQFA